MNTKEPIEKINTQPKKFSILSDSLINEIRNRSHSLQVPSIEDLYYCLDFVPKLKPKKNCEMPSPMNLDAKGLKSLKKNRKSQILLDINH